MYPIYKAIVRFKIVNLFHIELVRIFYLFFSTVSLKLNFLLINIRSTWLLRKGNTNKETKYYTCNKQYRNVYKNQCNFLPIFKQGEAPEINSCVLYSLQWNILHSRMKSSNVQVTNAAKKIKFQKLFITV